MEKENIEMIKNSLNEMIKEILDTCVKWVKLGEDEQLRFIDPIDGEEISAHYGATHAAVSFLIYGEKIHNDNVREMGDKLMDSILKRWKSSINLPGFHNDFNNFALCVAWDYLNKNNKNKKQAKKIKKLVLETPDSNNPTVNWFPMRWYVNIMRYRWTGKEKYKSICDKCRENIKNATYKDGFIDDRLPVGLSFNLQYDLATVAVMQYLRSIGEEIDISLEFGALLNIVAPDGDINYLGRGTNQIFAWGLWVYLLASAGKEEQLQTALDYLRDRIPSMLKNNNIMLNKWPGQEKYMWWDYHYSSVYTAHLLFWLIMAENQMNMYPVEEKIVKPGDSGLRIYRDKDYFVVTFNGRKEYIAEKGPCVGALWTKNAGMVVKGTFGPWKGAFGNKYSPIEAVIRNNCGLYKVKQNKDFSQNRYLHKLQPYFEIAISEEISPIFTDIEIKVLKNEIRIIWKTKDSGRKLLSIPCIEDNKMAVFVDGKETRLLNTSMIRNQYSWIKLYQTDIIKGNNWELRIER